jgi:hypothetical protein
LTKNKSKRVMPEQPRAIGYLKGSDKTDYKSGKNYLFGIGIKEYTHFSRLPNARKDVEDIFALLNSKYRFDPILTQTLFDNEATRVNIISKLHKLADCLEEHDRLLIYFSGHGFLNNRQLGYWIPVDAERDVIASYVANAEVRDIFKSIQAKHILLISDSCFSASLLVRDASRDIGSAFSDWDKNPSRYVFISGKGVVSDGEAGKNSPFASSILRQLSNNENEALNIVSLADSVTKEIRFNYEQQADISPLFDAGHLGGQFLFIQRDVEVEKWNTLNKTDKYALQDFIKQFPKSSHNIEANSHISLIIEKEIIDSENQAFEYAKQKRTVSSLAKFKRDYPLSIYNNDIIKLLAEVEEESDWKEAKNRNTLSAFLDYSERYRTGHFADECQQRIETIYGKMEKDEKEQKKDVVASNENREQRRSEVENLYQKPKVEDNKQKVEEQQLQLSENQNIEKESKFPFFKKNIIAILGGFSIIVVFLIWQMRTSNESITIQSTKLKDTIQSVQPDLNKSNTGNLDVNTTPSKNSHLTVDSIEKVLVKPESKRIVQVPATYETVTERVLVKPESKRTVQVPATYETATERVEVKPSSTKWVKVPKEGECLSSNPNDCLVWALKETQAEYKTVEKKMLRIPATTREEIVPAVYEKVNKQVLKTPATTREEIIPAVYEKKHRKLN